MKPSPSTDNDILAISDGIAQCARQIGGAFNTVAERLGDGLGVFEDLKSTFGDLSSELTGADTDKTRKMLTSLADEFRSFSEALPAETAMLQTMISYDAKASQTFTQLREHLQLIAVLARSTRIEAASLTSYREDIGSFTGKIITLTTKAKESIDDSHRAYGRLTSLLTNALAQQRTFTNRYRDSVDAVADKLSRSVEVIGQRVVKSAGLKADAARRTEELSIAVGEAIVSMQCGDSIRQRLEHVVSGLNAIDGFGAGPFALVIHALQGQQLEAADEALRKEVRAIDTALARLEGESRSMVELGRTLYSGDGATSNSYMDGLNEDLARASVLIEKCVEARDIVDRATLSLTSMVDLFRETEVGLSETIQDILMIGTNAGLLAGRLGNSGRGLVVIAKEVKAVASLIEKDAIPLGPLFAHLQEASRELRERHRGGSNQMEFLDKAIRAAVERMQSDRVRLDTALQRLGKGAGDFGGVVGECRQQFDEISTSFAMIETANEQLRRRSPVARIDDAIDFASVGAQLKQRVFSTYTMVEERQIYHRVLEELGFDSRETGREPLLAAG